MLKAAYDAFMSVAFEDAVDTATRAEWVDDTYWLRLFTDGSYQLMLGERLCDVDDFNVLIKLPTLSDGEWGESREDRYYNNARDHMEECYFDAENEAEQKEHEIQYGQYT